MTQAFNLSQFANKLNTSGAVDNTGLQNSSVTVTAGTGLTGGGAVALGSSVTISDANSGVSAGSYTNANITVNALGKITSASNGSSASGTVTSVATGNGLQGGTITSTGTLSVACPAFNSVGSYCLIGSQYNNDWVATAGSNYPTGTGSGQVYALQNMVVAGDGTVNYGYASYPISGSWKIMTGTTTNRNGFSYAIMLGCRVS